MMARIVSLYRYPVKGLTPEKMDSVTLAPGETLPFDRAFAIENGPGRFDPANPRHLPKMLTWPSDGFGLSHCMFQPSA